MGHGDRKGDRGRVRGNRGAVSPDAVLAEEKRRARELRSSAWWRKKIASGKCHYCGRVFHPDDLTMDHKIPLARGGTSDRINLVPACKQCNNRKKHLLPFEWEEYMESLKQQ
jgi:5-methylcytosine-specific restriction endonuclease McrA